MLDFAIDLQLSGPLFDGRAAAALDDYTEAVEEELSARGVRLVRHHLRRVLRNPTGFYEAHIRDRAVTDGRLVTDSRVIYGPWLEGVGERNRTTRFKGYATFRIVSGQLNRSAVYHAESIIDPYLARMGGRRT